VPQIPGVTPSIIDVGCGGSGAATRLLFDRFPNAKVLCIDKDRKRLESTQQDPVLASRLTCSFKCQSAEDHFAPSAGSGSLYDLIFANASLHWCSDVPTLLARMIGRVRPGGYLALQVPDNQGHRALFKEAAAVVGLAEADLKVPTMEADPAAYADALLGPRCSTLDMWTTTYVHCLAGSDNPVYDFMRNTFDGSTVLDSYSSHGKTTAFAEAYRSKVAAAYPRAADRKTTLFPFRRFFLVARRPGLLDTPLG